MSSRRRCLGAGWLAGGRGGLAVLGAAESNEAIAAKVVIFPATIA